MTFVRNYIHGTVKTFPSHYHLMIGMNEEGPTSGLKSHLSHNFLEVPLSQTRPYKPISRMQP